MAEIGAMQLLGDIPMPLPPVLAAATTILSSPSAPPLLRPGGYSHHVVELLAVFQDDDYIYLVLPYLSGGDMYSKVEASHGKGLAVDTVKKYFRQIANG